MIVKALRKSDSGLVEVDCTLSYLFYSLWMYSLSVTVSQRGVILCQTINCHGVFAMEYCRLFA